MKSLTRCLEQRKPSINATDDVDTAFLNFAHGNTENLSVALPPFHCSFPIQRGRFWSVMVLLSVPTSSSPLLLHLLRPHHLSYRILQIFSHLVICTSRTAFVYSILNTSQEYLFKHNLFHTFPYEHPWKVLYCQHKAQSS